MKRRDKPVSARGVKPKPLDHDWGYIKVITEEGYLFQVSPHDGTFRGAGVKFEGTDCTGDGWSQTPPGWITCHGAEGCYYTSKDNQNAGTPPNFLSGLARNSENVTFCSNFDEPQVPELYEPWYVVFPNNPEITGFSGAPEGGKYSLPVKIIRK